MIPATLREELGLHEGDRLSARAEGNRLILETPLAVLGRLQRQFREAAGIAIWPPS